MTPYNLNKLASDEKLETRFAGWLSTEGKGFASPEVAQSYQLRANRYHTAITLGQPDRVPCFLNAGNFVAKYAGVNHSEFFYDLDVTAKAMAKLYEDFDLDYQVAGYFFPGKVLDHLDYKLYSWPGGRLPKDTPFQCNEREYMTADEYDALIADPSAFIMRSFMPRVFGALSGLQMLPDFLGATELPFVPFMIAAMGTPQMQEVLKTMIAAGQAALDWIGASKHISAKASAEKGLPVTVGGMTKAPFDFIGDTMRGTRGIMLDLYRKPEKVLEACDRLVPIAVRMAVNAANQSGIPIVMIPLHKGADGFMSSKDFENFYWHSLKAVILGIIAEGVIPFLFAEGGYNQRLDIIADSGLPEGKTAWYFDRTDMAQAKKKIGSWACIGGNIPVSLFNAGTPQQMEDAVKKLMDVAAPGGGYFIAAGGIVDDANPANVHAFLNAARIYGTY
jgi:uroporphyrinogen-III decarboxylase